MSHPVGGPLAAGRPLDLHQPPLSSAGASFRDFLEDAARRIDQGRKRLDQAVAEGHRGRNLSQAELLGLQATVYRYTQELEIASKLVDKATSAVKTTLQSQQ